jgi:hypothetical protein
MAYAPFVLAGCAGNFFVAYDPVPADQAQSWRVKTVRVVAPDSLVVSEADEMIPQADVVWHADPAGDRLSQVAAVVKTGVEQGVNKLRGNTAVQFDVQITRFYAVTHCAYLRAPSGTGVNSVGFLLTVRDTQTNEVLLPKQLVEADIPATVAADDASGLSFADVDARTKAQIIGQIAATMRGMLGLGPDVRTDFMRMGR